MGGVIAPSCHEEAMWSGCAFVKYKARYTACNCEDYLSLELLAGLGIRVGMYYS
jgi:hypothetical protein